MILVPTHVARQQAQAALAARGLAGNGAGTHGGNVARSTESEFFVHDLDTPIPEGVPIPHVWKIALFPVRTRAVTRGGIILTDDTLEVQLWHHQLFKVAKVGSQVMRGPAYEGYTIAEEERPKVGDLWLINPKAPQRYIYKGIHFVVINDDQLISRIDDPSTVEHFKFMGFEL